MEISTVNSVVGQEWQRLHPIEGEAMGTISVQTWRRDTSAVALSCSDQQGNQRQQRSAAGDQATSVINMKRSSRFRGVSRHRWTGRYEAHLWDKGAWNPKRRKKGKQVYLGAYVEEESAARAYDLAALKYWGTAAVTNFPVSEYTKETEMMHTVTNEVYLAHLRRRSSGFSRGASRSRGVARHHHSGRWEARIGRGLGNKYLYLGTYGTQEQAARGYDMESIEHRGINAVTNCDSSKHIRWQRPAADPPAPESSSTIESLPFCNQIPSRDINQTRLSILHSNIYPSRPEGLDSLEKHDIIRKSKAPITPGATKSPSSTALGLLLKSSFFKELVEKNSTTSDEKINEKETKAPPQQAANNNDVGQIFYGGMSYSPYMFPSNRGKSAYLELKE